jgi:protein-tyrosine phosphatase
MRSAARILKRGVVDIYWNLRGPLIRLPEVPLKPRSVLFVCKGNICRSPFAEHLASKFREEGRIPQMKFGSAGLEVSNAVPPPNEAVRAAERYGVQLENHRSRPLSLKMVESYDMVVGMEEWHRTALASSFAGYQNKLFLLACLASDQSRKESGYTAFNIRDPYGGPPRAFEECFERIERCIEELFKVTGLWSSSRVNAD